MQNELRMIINHYGIKNQLKKLNEEVFELTEAILTDEDICHICEELADCYVLLAQIKYLFDLNDPDIKHFFEFKVERQLKRIAEENGEPTETSEIYRVGDTIEFIDTHECVNFMMDLARQGVQTDFVYQKDGVKGLWLIVTEVENGTN